MALLASQVDVLTAKAYPSHNGFLMRLIISSQCSCAAAAVCKIVAKCLVDEILALELLSKSDISFPTLMLPLVLME